MSFLSTPQGRALAIILPAVTLMAHAATFVVLEAVFAETWGASWCASYDLVAAAASAIGLLGAIQRCRMLSAAYLLVHTVTLSLISAVLLVNLLPPALISSIPFASPLKFDHDLQSLCRELDVGFRWDERWLDDCASSFSALTTGATWVGVVLMAAQWFVFITVWRWLWEKPNNAYNGTDLEKRQELDISEKV